MLYDRNMAGKKTDPEIVAAFAERFTLLRVEANIERSELAYDLRVPYTQLHSWGSGKFCPSMHYLVKIADYFDVPLDYLVGRSDNRKRR